MSEILTIRTQLGFSPADDEASEAMRRFPLGSIAKFDVKLMRNGAFFRKWWALVKVGYDYWTETCEPMMFKGQPVLPDFDRFRHDITIMAGFYRPVWNAKGEMRVEAESIAWASMSEERFGKLYNATVAALLKLVFNGKRGPRWTEEELRMTVEQIEAFAA
jgi:hypothetical protein